MHETKGSEREREREREREKQTDRQTDRDRETETYLDTDRHGHEGGLGLFMKRWREIEREETWTGFHAPTIYAHSNLKHFGIT